MKNKFRVILFTLIASILTLFPSINNTALAQDETSISALQNVILDIYPEYDDPRLLVMMEGQLTAVETLPAEIQFLVPTSAYMFSAGSIDMMGNYSGGTYNRIESGITGWDKIIYQVTTDTFRLEYYDPIIIGKTDKTIEYEFRTIYKITNLRVYIQEPLKSKDFHISPEGQIIQGQDKFNFHVYSYSTLSIDAEPLKYNIAYSKSDSRTSVAIAKASFPIIPVVIGAVAGIVVIICTILIMRQRQLKTSLTRKSENRRKSTETPLQVTRNVKSKTIVKSQKYCHQCGEALEKNTHFCPYCGAEQ